MKRLFIIIPLLLVGGIAAAGIEDDLVNRCPLKKEYSKSLKEIYAPALQKKDSEIFITPSTPQCAIAVIDVPTERVRYLRGYTPEQALIFFVKHYHLHNGGYDPVPTKTP